MGLGRIDPREAATEKQTGKTPQNFRGFVMDFKMKQSNTQIHQSTTQLQVTPGKSRNSWHEKAYSHIIPARGGRGSGGQFSPLADSAGNRNYQEGGVGCCDCSVGLDKRRLQLSHLLHGGWPDPVILGDCVFAWWRKKVQSNYKHQQHTRISSSEVQGENKIRKLWGSGQAGGGEKGKSVCDIRIFNMAKNST